LRRPVLVARKERLGVSKPILVVTSHFPKAIEERIDRDYYA
jgi:hypothetical protein